MRLIDIYRQTADGIAYVTGGCIQVGEPLLKRAPIVKSFTMADGTPVVYPAARDTVTADIELECTQREAAAIEPLIRGAEIIFAGLKLGAMVCPDLQKYSNLFSQTAVSCIVTGTAEIVEKYAKSGIYSVRMPVQILVDAAGNPAAGLTLPVIRIDSLTLDGTADGLARYHIEKKKHGSSRPGYLQRNSTFFTSASSLTFGYSCTELTGAAVSVGLYRNHAAVSSGTAAAGSFSVPLNVGRNAVELEILHTGSRPLYVGLTVYRQNVG